MRRPTAQTRTNRRRRRRPGVLLGRASTKLRNHSHLVPIHPMLDDSAVLDAEEVGERHVEIGAAGWDSPLRSHQVGAVTPYETTLDSHRIVGLDRPVKHHVGIGQGCLEGTPNCS